MSLLHSVPMISRVPPTTPDSVSWLGRCVQPAGNAAQKPECLTELVSSGRYRVVRYERPVGVVDRDDQPGRGTCRQSTGDTAFGGDPVRPRRAGSRRAFSAHRRHRAERLRGAGRRPGPAGGGRRVVASRRPATGRRPAGDGLRRRRPAVAADRDRRSGALGNVDAVGAAQRDACQAEPGAQRHARPADLRCRRLADGAACQPRAQPARCGGAAGLRRRRHQHHVGGCRVGVRADRGHHPLHRVLRRPDRSGAAEPRPGRHRQRGWHRPGRHRGGRFAHPAARGVPQRQGAAVGGDGHRTDRRTARIPLGNPGDPRRAGKPDRAAAGRGARRPGKYVGAQQD